MKLKISHLNSLFTLTCSSAYLSYKQGAVYVGIVFAVIRLF